MMINSAWMLFLLYAFQILSSSHAARINNDELRTCLASSFPLSTRTIYPCYTLANQNSPCDHFNITELSSVRGGRIFHSPAVIVDAMDSRDVQNVVKCATKLDYIVNALSGGHSYEAYGLGSADNNIIINMAAINYIHINPNDHTGIFGPGARLGPIYYKSYQYDQYTVNAGTCPWVGLAGHALGGGDGFLSRLHGLLSDNILEMKAVNTEGELLIINATHESELYWALRGGGGGLFVIVTEFKIRLIKSPSRVTTFSSVWSPDATKLVLQRYQSLIFNDTVFNLNNNIYLTINLNSYYIETIMVYYDDVLDEFNQTISLLLSTLPTPQSINIDEQDWLTFVYKRSWLNDGSGDPRALLLENLTYPTRYFKAKHLFYDQPISNFGLERFIDQLALKKAPYTIQFKPWDGYLSTIPVDETAFPHRNFKFAIQFMVFSDDKQLEQEQIDSLNEIYLSIYDDSAKYAYINYIDRDVPDWMNAYYRTHQQRLINIKNIYDKNNRFDFERTIPLNGGN